MQASDETLISESLLLIPACAAADSPGTNPRCRALDSLYLEFM